MDASVQANIQPAATKVTDMAYLSFRERPVEFTKKEPDDKPGYVMNDHLSNSAVTRESVGSYPAFPPLLA